MTAVGSFHQLLKPLIFYSKVLGVEMWTAPGKFLPASYYLSAQLAIYFISTVSTVMKYKHDPVYLMKVLVTLGTAVQLYIKFFVGHFKANEVNEITENIEQDILERYQKGTTDEVAVVNRTGRYLWIIFRISTITCVTCGAVFVLYPIFAYYKTGVLIPLLLYELPYLDHSTVTGYVVNMLFQLNLFVNGIMGMILADFVYFMFTMYAMAKADIFMVHLGELEALLNDPILNDPLKDDTKKSEIREKWLQCVLDHQRSTSFLNTVEDIFGLQCLAQVVMGVFTICDCMLLVALTDWYPTYCFLLVMFTELTGYFIVGHLIELKIDEMYEKVISMPWYKLSVKEQKEFLYLLCKQQRPMMLTAYGFHSMNFEAYMSVLKGLYQFFVMVMQYVG